MTKKIIMIAGPNGAGKTTFARAFLPEEAQCPHFINADLIAAGLSPFAPEAAAVKAGRLMLQEMSACTARGESFAFESTLSGLGYLRHIRTWQQLGYHISLFFLSLPTGFDKVGTTFLKLSFGGDSRLERRTSTATTARRRMPGRCTTTPATNL